VCTSFSLSLFRVRLPLCLPFHRCACLLSIRCWANFDLLLLYLKSGTCFWNLTLNGLPVCPVYFILYSRYVSWFTPLLPYLLWETSCLTARCSPIVLSAVNAIVTFVLLKSFVINLVCLPTYVNFAHLCFWLFCLCLFSLLKFFKEETSYLFLTKICCILSISFCLISGVSLYISLEPIAVVPNCCCFVFLGVAWVVRHYDVSACRFPMNFEGQTICVYIYRERERWRERERETEKTSPSCKKVKFVQTCHKAWKGSIIHLYSFFNLGAIWGRCSTPLLGRFKSGNDPVHIV